MFLATTCRKCLHFDVAFKPTGSSGVRRGCLSYRKIPFVTGGKLRKKGLGFRAWGGGKGRRVEGLGFVGAVKFKGRRV